MTKSRTQDIIRRRANGESLTSIADALNVSVDAVVTCVTESAHLVTNAINCEKDAFLERTQMTAPKRLEQKVEMMKKISDELLSRDLSQVPADKLLEMLIRLEDKTANALRVMVGKMKSEDVFDELQSLSEPRQRLVVTEV